ncbi:MAG: polyketide cyclase [Gammaproteobacteria bacterium]|nr:MAG: polyketide cyclase [Gammaproteobacteria bacterium]
MWTKTHSKVYQGIKKEDIWRIWADVNNWPKWDKELESCEMKGSFEERNQFILKPKGGPKVKITLSEVKPNEKFTDYCKFIGATMYDMHELEETSDGLRITNTIMVSGPLGFIWVYLVAKGVANSVPKQMDALVELARS